MAESETELPFSLAYLNWCEKRGIKTFEETENRRLVCEFYYDKWAGTGKPVDGIELALALGVL